MSSVVTVLGSVAAIIGAIYGVFKWVTWKTQTTPQEAKQEIDHDVQQEQKKVEETGRPA